MEKRKEEEKKKAKLMHNSQFVHQLNGVTIVIRFVCSRLELIRLNYARQN